MRWFKALLTSALLLAALATTSSQAWADDQAEFEKGRNAYNAGDYSTAASRFAAMLDPKAASPITDAAILERSRIYWAASLLALGRSREADSVIETVLRANPLAAPDPVVFPTQLLDRFADVRAKIREELEAKTRARLQAESQEREKALEAQRKQRERIAALEKLAQQEVHVVHNSRWVAMLPFGVGQFQNGQQGLGWTFLLTESALATTTIVTSGIVQALESQGTRPNVDLVDLNDRIDSVTRINHYAFGAMMLMATAGIVHAQLTFVPERREVHARPLPKSSAVVPFASGLSRGGVVGITGVF